MATRGLRTASGFLSASNPAASARAQEELRKAAETKKRKRPKKPKESQGAERKAKVVGTRVTALPTTGALVGRCRQCLQIVEVETDSIRFIDHALCGRNEQCRGSGGVAIGAISAEQARKAGVNLTQLREQREAIKRAGVDARLGTGRGWDVSGGLPSLGRRS